MDRKIQQSKFRINAPDYRKIYTDMIEMKYLDKRRKCETVLSKAKLSMMDIFELEKIIFETNGVPDEKENGKFRAYDDESILQILTYQKKNKMTNTDISNHFKISRNSIAKWKKLFPEI